MPDTFVEVNSSGRLRRRTPVQVSAGAGDAGKIAALDSAGKFDISLLPASVTSGSSLSMQASESLAEGDWVNIYNNGGTLMVRKALAADETKPVNGFVREAVTGGNNANVYFGGDNDKVNPSGFAAANGGNDVFLSATVAGGCTPTPPSTTGQLLQRIGKLIGIGTYAVVRLDFGLEVLL